MTARILSLSNVRRPKMPHAMMTLEVFEHWPNPPTRLNFWGFALTSFEDTTKEVEIVLQAIFTGVPSSCIVRYQRLIPIETPVDRLQRVS